MVMMIYSRGVVIPEVEIIPNECIDGRFVVKNPDDANQLHDALVQWSKVPGGCQAEVVFEPECAGKTLELPGTYIFHGHQASLNLTGVTNEKENVPMLHSSKGLRLFTFTGGASIRAKSIGFQGGSGKSAGAVELNGEGSDSDSTFHHVVFDHDEAASSGGAVVITGSHDTDQVTEASFHDCVFRYNKAMQGGALMIAPSRGKARVEIEGVTFESNEATDDGGAIYVAGGELVIVGDDNHFKGNKAGHREADLYTDVAQGGHIIHVPRKKKEGEEEKSITDKKKSNTSEL